MPNFIHGRTFHRFYRCQNQYSEEKPEKQEDHCIFGLTLPAFHSSHHGWEVAAPHQEIFKDFRKAGRDFQSRLLAFLAEWDGRKCLHKWQSISRIATMIYAKVRTASRASFTLFKDLHRRRDIWRQKVCERRRCGLLHSPRIAETTMPAIKVDLTRLLPSHLSGLPSIALTKELWDLPCRMSQNVLLIWGHQSCRQRGRWSQHTQMLHMSYVDFSF